MNAFMSNFDLHHKSEPLPPQWEGFAEVDRAIRENRITEYRLKKAWADPLNRKVIVMVALILLGFAGFVFVNDVIL